MENSQKRTLKVTSSQQFELLCMEMKKHPEVATNKPTFGGSKANVDTVWIEISGKLNGIGPPHRDVVEWKKVWSELKGRTKKKISTNQQSLTATGGGPYECETLTPLEEMVDEVTNIRSAAVPPGNVCGISRIVDSPPSGSQTNMGHQHSTSTSTRKRTADTTSDLLKEQVSNQKELIKAIKVLNETQEKILSSSDRQARATEKLCEIAESFFNYLTTD